MDCRSPSRPTGSRHPGTGSRAPGQQPDSSTRHFQADKHWTDPMLRPDGRPGAPRPSERAEHMAGAATRPRVSCWVQDRQGAPRFPPRSVAPQTTAPRGASPCPLLSPQASLPRSAAGDKDHPPKLVRQTETRKTREKSQRNENPFVQESGETETRPARPTRQRSPLGDEPREVAVGPAAPARVRADGRQLYAHTLSDSWEPGPFLKNCKPPKVSQDETDNRNGSRTIEAVGFAVITS